MSVRRDREKEQERREKIRYWAQQSTPPPLPLQKATLESLAGKHLLLVARVSTPSQKSDLTGQLLYLIHSTESFNATIAGIHTYIANGSDESHWQTIANKATLLEVDGILFESTCRSIRHPQWGLHQADPEAQQVNHFITVYQHHNLYTCLDPEATLEDIQKHQAKRGQNIKGRGGAGNKRSRARFLKRRRELLLPIVVRMRSEGESNKEIARQLCITARMVRYWVEQYSK